MNSRGIARLSSLALGLIISAAVVLTPDIAGSSVVNAAPGTGNSSVSGASELVAQQGNGCERTRKPACNRPGRRSSHR
jgi:hypothetical protein